MQEGYEIGLANPSKKPQAAWCTIKNVKFWQTVTHVPLIIALFFLAFQQKWWYFSFLLAAIFFSIVHHLLPDQWILMMFEWILVIGVSIYLFVEYQNDFDTSDWILLGFALGFFFWSLYEFYYKGQRCYDFSHCVWHILGGALLLKLVVENPEPN